MLESGHRWGEAAAPFQRDDARAVLSGEAPHYHFLTRPRGASKSTDLAGIVLAALLTQAAQGSRSYGVAADRDQAKLLLDAASGFATRTPGLGALAFTGSRISYGNASFEVLASDAASAYGIRPYFCIADELTQWPSTAGPRAMWTAVASAMPKVAGARLVVLTTAGDPAHWANDIRRHALSSPAWHVNEVPGPTPWLDPSALAEQAALLTPSQYARLHLNQWVSSEDRLTTADQLAACVQLDGPQSPRPGVKYAIGLDVGLVNDRTAIAVCHREGDSIYLDRLIVFSGSRAEPVPLAQVEDTVAQLASEYRPCRVVFDIFQAAQLTQSLKRRGTRIRQESFTVQTNSKRATLLYNLIRNGNLALPDDAELLDELANVRLKETSPGVLRLDHDASRHDDRAVALSLAADELYGAPAGRAIPRVVSFER